MQKWGKPSQVTHSMILAMFVAQESGSALIFIVSGQLRMVPVELQFENCKAPVRFSPKRKFMARLKKEVGLQSAEKLASANQEAVLPKTGVSYSTSHMQYREQSTLDL